MTRFLIIITVFITLCTLESFGQVQLDDGTLKNKFSSDKLPFEGLLIKTPEGLREMGFKYDKNKNCYKLKKYSKETKRDRILWLTTRKNATDYEIVIYMGKTGISLVQVWFYDAIVYGAIRVWVKEWKKKAFFVKMNKLELTEFDHNSYTIRVIKTIKKIENHLLLEDNYGPISNAAEDLSFVLTTSGKEYSSYREYNSVYLYSILTGEKPNSKWLDRRNKQKARKKVQKKDLDEII